MSPIGAAPSLRAAAVVAALPPGTPVVVVRDGDEIVVGAEPAEVLVADGPAALAGLGGLTPGWWGGVIAYDFGRTFESVPLLHRPDGGGADVTIGRFDARLAIGPHGERIVGDGALPRVLRRAIAMADSARVDGIERTGPWQTSLDHAAWNARMHDVEALLRAGGCYQLNLTRRLYATAHADPVALFGRIATRHPAPYTALVTIGGPSIVSASPELFLRYGDGTIESRPIKGTGRSTRELLASEKDRIENVMIVDLVRNDLDRVCAPGTVTVAALCEPEQHPGLVHLVSRVTGGLLPHIDVVDILAATFPPASITGIPKASVLRSIETLEPVRRGAYCGAVGWFDTAATRGELAVAIRTFTVLPDELRLGVGGGITIASDADDEWSETELKAARLVSLVDDVAVDRPTRDATGRRS